MRTAKRQSVLVPTTLALIFGIVIGAVGITIIQQPAASHPAPGARVSALGKAAPSDQPINEARAAAGAVERPQTRKEPSEQQVAPGDAPEAQPQAQEEQTQAKQLSAWELLPSEQKEAERWKEVRRVTGKPALRDTEAREAYFKLPFSIKLQMEYALTKDERFGKAVQLHREIARSVFLQKMLTVTFVPWPELLSKEELAKLTAKMRSNDFAESTETSLKRLNELPKLEQIELLNAVFPAREFGELLTSKDIAADTDLRIALHTFSEQTSAETENIAANPHRAPALIWPILARHPFEAYPLQ